MTTAFSNPATNRRINNLRFPINISGKLVTSCALLRTVKSIMKTTLSELLREDAYFKCWERERKIIIFHFSLNYYGSNVLTSLIPLMQKGKEQNLNTVNLPYHLLPLCVPSSAIYFWIQRGAARDSPAFRDDRLDSLEHCLRTIRIQWLKAIWI